MFFTTTHTDVQSFDTIAEAKAAAYKITEEQRVEVQVLGHVAGQDDPILVGHTSPFVDAEGFKVVGHFQPWTRVELTMPTTFVPPFVPDYAFAYVRTRIQTAVYRPNTKGSPWLVWNTLTGEKVFAAGTKGARMVTNRMRGEANAVAA